MGQLAPGGTHTDTQHTLTEYNKTRREKPSRKLKRSRRARKNRRPRPRRNNQQPNDIIILQVEFISVLLLPLLKEIPFLLSLSFILSSFFLKNRRGKEPLIRW